MGILSAKFTEQLVAEDSEVITIFAGETFEAKDKTYTIRPDNHADYDLLWADLIEHERLPNKAIHLWSMKPAVSARP